MAEPTGPMAEPTGRIDGRPSQLSHELLHVADTAVDAALAIVADRPAGRLDTGVTTKSTDTDLVTRFDTAAEAAIRAVVKAHRPLDGIVGEEGDDLVGRSGLRWIIDPIDGTTNFVYDHPSQAISVAVADREGPLVGVVHDFSRGERFRATRGGGAERDGTPIALGPAVPLGAALVATGFGYDPDRRRRQAKVLSELIGAIRDIRRMGAASLDLCGVACGRVDAYFEVGIAEWDVAAGGLIASEAGAVVSALDGGPPKHGEILACHPALAEQLSHLLIELGAHSVDRSGDKAPLSTPDEEQ